MKTILTLIFLASAFWFFGMPYYYAYKRCQKLKADATTHDNRKNGLLSSADGNET